MSQISMDDLEMKYWDCNGKGFISSGKNKEKCTKCNGKGVILTGQGQTLLHFIKKHQND